MRRRLRDSVVVITGASSGIGRATALQFAARGAAVVLAARREAPLRELERDCVARGGRALARPTDVTREGQLQALAARAIETFGRIDVWVNNAGVTMFGRFEESPVDDYERVLRTNLLGYVYGARTAIPYFREQGAGVLINVGSVVGVIAQPYTSAYAVSKFGIRGLTEGLRMELLDARHIHACSVLPASIDTPLFQHAANFTGHGIQPLDPVYPAEQVARAIVRLARRPRREVVVGTAGGALILKKLFFPAIAERIMARQVEHSHFSRNPAERTRGNLYNPMAEGAGVSGGWRQTRRAGNGTRLLQGLLLLAVPVGAYYLWQRQRRPGLSERMAQRIPGAQRLPGMRRRGLLASIPLLGWFGSRRMRPLGGRGGRLMARRRMDWTHPIESMRGAGYLPSKRQTRRMLEDLPDRRQARRLLDRVADRQQARELLERLPDRKQAERLWRQLPDAEEGGRLLGRRAKAGRKEMERLWREMPELEGMPPMRRRGMRRFMPQAWWR